MDSTIAKGGQVGVSAISVAGVVNLVEKGLIPASAARALHYAAANAKAVIQHIAFDEYVAMTISGIPRRNRRISSNG
jgi:hypothetical protein